MSTPADTTQPATSTLAQMRQAAMLLAGFAVLASALLGIVYAVTANRIAEQQAESLRATLGEVLDRSRYTNDLLADTITVADPALGTDQPQTVYRARRGGQAVAALFTVIAPDGYSGAIRLLVGVQPNGELTGVRVLEHRETPGLGDKIETRKSDWVTQFDGLSLDQPRARNWAVRKDGGAFDSFTGATITPRAVVAAVKNALLYARSKQEALYDSPADDPGADR